MACRLEVRAIGKPRGALAALIDEYSKRLPELTLKSWDAPKGLTGGVLQAREAAWLLAGLPAGAVIVALDERGRDDDSAALAAALTVWQERGTVVFLLGGADGLAQTVRDRAHQLLALGRKTWPHMLARVMLLEQIYRARMIAAGHPYHRS